MSASVSPDLAHKQTNSALSLSCDCAAEESGVLQPLETRPQLLEISGRPSQKAFLAGSLRLRYEAATPSSQCRRASSLCAARFRLRRGPAAAASPARAPRRQQPGTLTPRPQRISNERGRKDRPPSGCSPRLGPAWSPLQGGPPPGPRRGRCSGRRRCGAGSGPPVSGQQLPRRAQSGQPSPKILPV